MRPLELSDDVCLICWGVNVTRVTSLSVGGSPHARECSTFVAVFVGV